MSKALEQRWLGQGKNCKRELECAIRLGLLITSAQIYKEAGSDYAPVILQDLDEYPGITEPSLRAKKIILPRVLVDDVHLKVPDLTFSSWMARILTVYTRFHGNNLKLFIEQGDEVVEINPNDFTGLNN